MDQVVQFSLYPHAYALAIIPLDKELPEISLEPEYLESFSNPEVYLYNLIRYRPRSFKFPMRSLFLYWSSHREEWVAFDVVHIPVDVMYDETYCTYAKSLNDSLRAKLLDVHSLELNDELTSRIKR